MSGRKPVSFWRENFDTVVIFQQDFAKMLSRQKQVKNTFWQVKNKFWYFSIGKKAQLPAIKITEQPILQIKTKINRPG